MYEYQLNDLQEKLLGIFSFFHSFCIEHNLRYYCLGGTMLGAVRHEGFIPWDDDIDVGLPRKDYEKLLSLLGGRKTCGYLLESPYQGAREFLYSYSKLYDTGTTLVENTRYKIKRGIAADVFPLDGMGNSEEEAKRNYKDILPWLNLLAARACALRKGRKLYKNTGILVARMIPQSVLPDRKILEKIHMLSTRNDFDNCTFVGNIDGAWREREIIGKKVFGEPKLYKFNGLDACGVSDPDAYLTHLYGEWRKLPPKDKRVTHHNYLEINLNKPYLP